MRDTERKTSLQNITLRFHKNFHNYSMLVTLYNAIWAKYPIAHNFVGTDGFEIKIENEYFAVDCSRCCHKVKP